LAVEIEGGDAESGLHGSEWSRRREGEVKKSDVATVPVLVIAEYNFPGDDWSEFCLAKIS
jgi:hypothetical protein